MLTINKNTAELGLVKCLPIMNFLETSYEQDMMQCTCKTSSTVIKDMYNKSAVLD
jgi:hypothetical protein